MRWIDQSGDRDGDGFQEYETRSTHGYYNQGWKDAGDAIPHADGSLAPLPLALCELQGYVYDAKLRMADIYDVLGRPGGRAPAAGRGTRASSSGSTTRSGGRPRGPTTSGSTARSGRSRSVASNAGHCLANGIVPPERAGRVVERLMADDMWSGWGIRTLSSDHAAYNPFSYHTGSVWPHDNAMIAGGFRRYGHDAEAAAVARGHVRRDRAVPGQPPARAVRRPAARRGQLPGPVPGRQRARRPGRPARSSGWSPSCAGIHAPSDAQRSRLYVDPALPDWLPELTISNLRAGDGAVGCASVDGTSSPVATRPASRSSTVAAPRPARWASRLEDAPGAAKDSAGMLATASRAPDPSRDGRIVDARSGASSRSRPAG